MECPVKWHRGDRQLAKKSATVLGNNSNKHENISSIFFVACGGDAWDVEIGLEHWNCGAVHVQLESHVVRSYNVQNRRNSRRTMYTIHLCRMSGVLLIGGSGSGDCSCRDRCCRRDYSFVPEGPLTNQSKL